MFDVMVGDCFRRPPPEYAVTSIYNLGSLMEAQSDFEGAAKLFEESYYASLIDL